MAMLLDNEARRINNNEFKKERSGLRKFGRTPASSRREKHEPRDGRPEERQTTNFVSTKDPGILFYSAPLVCAADCPGGGTGNESWLKRSIKNVNSPNCDIKRRIALSTYPRTAAEEIGSPDCNGDCSAPRTFAPVRARTPG
ncbi:hypothetical protein KM043_012068 [Ampulex compressa]|nr:hypothetical protein KM043_012068 [Ampulex compressa]